MNHRLNLIAACVMGLTSLAICDSAAKQAARQIAINSDAARHYSDAKVVLLQEAESTDPVTRMEAMEAIGRTLKGQAGGVLMQGLKDDAPTVRYAAAMAIGDSKYVPAKARLTAMAADKQLEPNRFVFCAVIYALHTLGDDQYTPSLGEMLFDLEPEVRASAVMAMEKIGEPSAITPLKRLLAQEQDPTVRLRVVEALAVLGDQKSANLLEAYTKSQFMDERIDAIIALEKVKSDRNPVILRQMIGDRQPAFVRVAAAGAMGSLGLAGEDQFNLVVDAARFPVKMLSSEKDGKVTQAEVDSLQQLAAWSLGLLGHSEAFTTLGGLMQHPSPKVRIAAAMSELWLLNSYGNAEEASQAEAAASPSEPAGQSAAPAAATGPAGPTLEPLPVLRSAGGRD